MKEINRDNATINYQLKGNGNTTLLFVHGSYNDQTYWASQLSYFSPRYTVVTLDLPGHGKSGKGRKNWSIDGFAQDVITVIQELNLTKVILIGHSLGAEISLIAATSYPDPVLGFVAVDFFKNAATPLAPDYQEQADGIRQQLQTDFAHTNEQYAHLVLLTKQTPAEISKRVINDYRNAYVPMGIATTPQIFTMFEIEQKLLPLLQFKLYLINVTYQPTNEAALKKQVTHGYDIAYMQGTSHFPMLEHPEELNELLELAFHKITDDEK